MKHGLEPIKKDKRDYSFHKSFGSVAFDCKVLPDHFNVDAGITMPNQEEENSLFHPPVPPLPYGCTDYTQTELCTDEDGIPYNPLVLENITHANANGGADIRVALDAAKKVLGRTAYFNIRSSGVLDWFDAMRVALWITQQEKRSVSIGTPWYPEWAVPQGGVLPIPVSFSTRGLPWHNWKISGWKTINGVTYLMGKTWQGPNYGDGGWCYVSRELINAVMNIRGTGAFTLSKTAPTQIATVDWSIVDTLVAFIRSLLSKAQPKPGACNEPTVNSKKLYDTAKAHLDEVVAPLNATDGFGTFGCMITINTLSQLAWGHPVGGEYSTAAAMPFLKDQSKFALVPWGEQQPGDIIISPTGSSGINRFAHGHVGVCGIYGIMSNNSEDGKLEQNYTYSSWKYHYGDMMGFPIYLFRAL